MTHFPLSTARIRLKFSFVGLFSISRTFFSSANYTGVSNRMSSFVPLPKSQNPDRVRSNFDVFNFEISEEDIEKLDQLDRGKDGAVTWNPVDVD